MPADHPIVRCYPNFKEATKMKKKSFAILLAAALLLYLLPGMALEAKAETVRNICFSVRNRQILRLQDSSDTTTISIM